MLQLRNTGHYSTWCMWIIFLLSSPHSLERQHLELVGFFLYLLLAVRVMEVITTIPENESVLLSVWVRVCVLQVNVYLQCFTRGRAAGMENVQVLRRTAAISGWWFSLLDRYSVWGKLSVFSLLLWVSSLPHSVSCTASNAFLSVSAFRSLRLQ